MSTYDPEERRAMASYVAKPQGFLLENAYAFAPLPPVPGPEVFKEETT